jgi:hypothetical protein
MEEEAFVDNLEDSSVGTGAFLAMMKLFKKLPNIVQVYGLKLLLSHDLITKILKRFLSYHEMDFKCMRWS